MSTDNSALITGITVCIFITCSIFYCQTKRLNNMENRLNYLTGQVGRLQHTLFHHHHHALAPDSLNMQENQDSHPTDSPNDALLTSFNSHSA